MWHYYTIDTSFHIFWYLIIDTDKNMSVSGCKFRGNNLRKWGVQEGCGGGTVRVRVRREEREGMPGAGSAKRKRGICMLVQGDAELNKSKIQD